MRKGYSLIEMIIVIAILAIVMPTVFSIIYVLLQQQLRIFRVSATKREGDRIMGFMKEVVLRDTKVIYRRNGTIRCANASGTPEVTSDGTDFIFASTTAGQSPGSSFYISGNRLMYEQNPGGTARALHSNQVQVSNLQFQCLKKNSVTNPLVGIAFTVTFDDKSPTLAEGTVSFQYHTKIKLR